MAALELIACKDVDMINRRAIRSAILLHNEFFICIPSFSDQTLRFYNTYKAIKHNNFDLIVLDLNMPGISGIELIKLIHTKHAKLPILIFSMRHVLQSAQKALQAGATGFVTKGSGPNTLISAIKMVAAGERFLDVELLDMIMLEKKSSQFAGEQGTSYRT